MRLEADHLKAENSDPQREQHLLGQAVHVPDRAVDGHGETCPVRLSSHEASSVAPEKSLACARGFGENHSSAQITPSPSGLVAGQRQCVTGPAPTPSLSRSVVLYRCIKRRLGHTLRGLHRKRPSGHSQKANCT